MNFFLNMLTALVLVAGCRSSIDALILGPRGAPVGKEGLSWQLVEYQSHRSRAEAEMPGSIFASWGGDKCSIQSEESGTVYCLTMPVLGIATPPGTFEEFYAQVREREPDADEVYPIEYPQKGVLFAVEIKTYNVVTNELVEISRHYQGGSNLYKMSVRGADFSAADSFLESFRSVW